MNLFARIKNAYAVGYAYMAKAVLYVILARFPMERDSACRGADLTILILRERKDEWDIRERIQEAFARAGIQYLHEVITGTLPCDKNSPKECLDHAENLFLRELSNSYPKN